MTQKCDELGVHCDVDLGALGVKKCDGSARSEEIRVHPRPTIAICDGCDASRNLGGFFVFFVVQMRWCDAQRRLRALSVLCGSTAMDAMLRETLDYSSWSLCFNWDGAMGKALWRESASAIAIRPTNC
jgi:hypothetical protein